MATKKLPQQKPNKKPANPVWIRFMAPVMPNTTTSLMKCIDQAIASGSDYVHLMISSNGGSVFHGMSVHNYLKGLKIGITTYNFGSADSIATIIFCAGEKRVCVPHARFLIHPVTMQFNGQGAFKEKDLEEFSKSVNIDSHNIARIISDTTGKKLPDVEHDMQNRTTLNPSAAKSYGDNGLATSIEKDLYSGGNLHAIYETGETFSYIPNPIITSTGSDVKANLYNVQSDNK